MSGFKGVAIVRRKYIYNMLVKTFSDIERPSVIEDKGHSVIPHLCQRQSEWTAEQGASTSQGCNNNITFHADCIN